MCKATAYIERDGQQEKVLNIASTGIGLVLIRLLEPPKTVWGVMREVDFLKHSVRLIVKDKEHEQSN